MKCTACGSDSAENAQFCAGCGASLSAPAVSGIGVGTAELPMVSFIDAIKLGFNNYATFSGRATRAEFWWFYLFSTIGSYGMLFIFGIFAAGVSGVITATAIMGIGYVAFILIFGIPQMALSSRLLHDTGRSGWRLLLSMVPFGGIFLLVWWCQKGNAGPNKYGPDPRQATSQ
jgi:uncharacterized membrane protein YhaH (DUF805 family)